MNLEKGERNMVFFIQKVYVRWHVFSMKYHTYWLLKVLCFELFWDWRYGLFLFKKLMERWYLLGIFELPWYSWTWEIWFLMQCFIQVHKLKQTYCTTTRIMIVVKWEYPFRWIFDWKNINLKIWFFYGMNTY